MLQLLLLALLPLQADPLSVTIRAGAKTHGPGEHDHPRFLEEWSELLTSRGCSVRGGLEFPDAATLDATDVLVMYAADAGSIHDAERERLEAYLGRGGGIVVLHDAVCGDDPHWFKSVVGGAWEHGHSKWQNGLLGLYFADREHPITRGVSNFDFDDEIYWDLHLDPDAQVLASSFHTPFDVQPQMWVFEKEGYRSFVSLQGHYHRTFSNPAWRTLVLRGIAWAGRRDADLLVTDAESQALRYPPGGPLAPEEAHTPHVLHPDFELSLVAAEPEVVNPISVEWDARGRMWVACTPGYPYKQESSGVAAHDSIVILEDDDGDGRMDRSKVFYEGLDLVTSLVHYRDGVIVTMSPHILWVRDLDGDDVADRVEVLYTGFGYGDTHATASNLRWGMDGWVYATQGYSGGASKEVLGFETTPRPEWSSPPVPQGGRGLGMDSGGAGGSAGTLHGRIPNGLFRFRPDGSAIEMVASYGSNTWGLDFRDDGELFFTMANGSHVRHVVMADRVLAGQRVGNAPSWVDVSDHRKAFPLSDHHRPPYHQIDFVGGFTGAAGSVVYGGGAWPVEFAGNHFVCEPTIHLVHRDVVRPAGLTVTASKPREAEFLASTDLWFRPVHLATGPDGALYVLDFYNQAAVHNDTRGPKHGPTNAAVRPDRDRMHGRIWRVQHRDARGVAAPAPPADLANAERVAQLGHTNRWQRLTAQRLLREAGDAPSEELVLFSHQAAEPLARLHALWLLDNLGAQDADIVAALDDPDPAVRWSAARILGRRGGSALPEELLVLVLDESPRVLLEALVAFASFDLDPELAPAFAELYLELDDDWTRSALLGLFAEQPALLLDAALADPRAAELGPLAVECAKRVARAGDTDGIASAARRLADGSLAAAPELIEGVLQAVARALPDRVDLAPAEAPLTQLLNHERIGTAIAALPLAARLPGGAELTGGLAARLFDLTADPDQPTPLRLDALDALLAMPDEETRALGVRAGARFLDPYFPQEAQLAVVDALGAAAGTGGLEQRAAATLVAAYPGLSHPTRERIFHHLVQRAERLAVLLAAVEEGELHSNDLGPHRRHRLETHPEPAVAERARALFARELDADKEALIAALQPEIERGGDPLAGRLVFQENCANCHSFEGNGGAVGPDLTGMGAHGRAALLPFLIDPNREVDPTYVDYIAETVDGRLLTGVLVRETPADITLRSSAGEEVVARDQLESLTSTGRSPMPEGLEELGAEALRDVLAYLTAGVEDYRVLDLSLLGTSTTNALYDLKRDAKPMRFRATGVVEVGEVPFEILDPGAAALNAVTLKGGMAADWDSKLKFPQTVTVPVGFALERVHVLGGIAAWGYPFTPSRSPIVRWTWRYADGTSEELVLHDGDRFADWIRRHDVEGSVYADVLVPGSVGQVRHFTLDPGRRDVAVAAIELESFDNHLAPTFLALTAQVAGADEAAPIPPAWTPPAAARVLVFGGGSSHDFRRWFHEEDFSTLAEYGARLAYTEMPTRLAALLPQLDVLVLCNNQPLPDPGLREAIFDFHARGGALLLMHAATWYNWSDWPEYNARLVGGGARSHEAYGEFVVTLDEKQHPVLAGARSSFGIVDELYRFERDQDGAAVEVLATGTSVSSGEAYPVIWRVASDLAGAGRVLCITLGHDGAAHTNPDFQALLRSAVAWLLEG